MAELADTSPDADRIQIELLRRKTPAQRASLASQITNQALRRAKAGIARARPDLTRQERDLLFVEVHYGVELAGTLRRVLADR